MRYLSAAAGRGPHPCTPYAGLQSACCRSPRQAPHSVILAPLPTRGKAYCMPREEPRKPAQNTAFSAMFPPSPARPAVKMTELRQTARAGEEYGAARPRPKRRRCHFIAMVSGKRPRRNSRRPQTRAGRQRRRAGFEYPPASSAKTGITRYSTSPRPAPATASEAGRPGWPPVSPGTRASARRYRR